MRDGGPAFPNTNHPSQQDQIVAGMTLRDYFAAKAMQAMIAARVDEQMRGHSEWRQEFSREAVRYADDLLRELESTP